MADTGVVKMLLTADLSGLILIGFNASHRCKVELPAQVVI
jgi:hypothetical protein